MESGKGAEALGLDARLLRFRSRAGSEDHASLAEALQKAGRSQDAIEVATAGLRTSPDDGRLLLVEGQAWLAEGQLERAQQALINAARVASKNKDVFRTLGEVLLKRGDPVRALKVIERARAIDPEDRALKLLYDRCARFARLAESEGGEQAAEASVKAMEKPSARKPEGSFEDDDERTVVRADLATQAAEQSAARSHDHDDEESEDDEPTRMADGNAIMKAAMEQARGPAPAPAAPKAAPLPAAARPAPAAAPRAAAPVRPGTLTGVGPTAASPAARVPATALGAKPAAPAATPAAKPAPAAAPVIPTRPRAATLTGVGPSGGAKSPFGAPAVPVFVKPAPPAPTHESVEPAPAPKERDSVPPQEFPFGSLRSKAPPQDLVDSTRDPFGGEVEPDPFPQTSDDSQPTIAARSGELLAGTGLRDPKPAPAHSSSPFGDADPFAEPAMPPLAAPRAAPQAARPVAPAPPAASPFTPAEPPFGAAEPLAQPAIEPAAQSHVDPTAFSDFDAPDGGIPSTDEEGPPPAPAPDVAGGSDFGAPENVDAILAMLEREGIFEPPSATPRVWAVKKEVDKGGTKQIGRTFGVIWVLALLVAGGGWFGWTQWIAQRHAQAGVLRNEARADALRGDHANLVDAERKLREARDLDANNAETPTVLLFVQAQRALEEGSFDPGYLRPTIAPDRRPSPDAAYLKAASAVVMAADGQSDQAKAALLEALTAKPDDALLLYLAGRLEQRLGADTALAHLEAAVQKEPKLFAATIALAEVRSDEGNREDALRLLDAVLAQANDHLRATLWRTLLGADEVDPTEGLARIDGMRERLGDQGAPTDKVLADLVRARLLRRKGDTAGAAAAVDRAMGAGATEPRLLALLAAEARGAGRLDRAQQAAMMAIDGAPTNPDFRKLLAQVLIERRDGTRALATLRTLSTDDPDVLFLSAKAALLVGNDEVLQAVAVALDAFVAAHPDAAVEAKALRLRARVRIGPVEGENLLTEARALSQEAPGDPLVLLALGEVALHARDARVASEALGQLVRASGDDPDAHFLVGRAKRLGGDAEGAEQSFRRALEILPEHVEARSALGQLLLDRGKFAEADTIFQELARRSGLVNGLSPSLLGRLGRVESLIGLARLDDANVQLEAVRTQDRELASYRLTAARLFLAKGRAGDALSQLRPLTTESDPPNPHRTAEALALYGDALLAAGQGEPATAAYDAAIAVDSAYPEALLGRAQVCLRAESAADAIDYLARVSESLEHRIRPPGTRAQLLTARGRAHLLAEDAELARTDLEAATQLEGVPAEAWFWLGEVRAASSAPEARVAYEKYLELAADGEYAARARRAIAN